LNLTKGEKMNKFIITHKLAMLDKQDLEDIIFDLTKREKTSRLYIIKSIDDKINKSLRGVKL
jgi:hypothetical protein